MGYKNQIIRNGFQEEKNKGNKNQGVAVLLYPKTDVWVRVVDVVAKNT